MSNLNALIVTFVSLSFLTGCGCNNSSRDDGKPAKQPDQPGGVPTPSAPKDLAALLKARGYIEIPLSLTTDPLLDVEVKINGQPLRFILDTGANQTTIDEAAAERLKLPTHASKKMLYGATGAQILVETESVRTSVGPNWVGENLAVSDLRAVNASRKILGTPPCDGILGNNFMQVWGAVIDEAAPKLFLLEQAEVFWTPAGLASKADVFTSLKDGRVSRAVTVEIPDNEAPVVSKSGFEQLKHGMTFAQVSEILGGDLKKARTIPGFTGTLAVSQGKRRIDLAFADGKVSSKSAQGIDGIPAGAAASAAADAVGTTSTLLAEFLKARGYIEVPLNLSKDSFFEVGVKANGEPLLFFLDTGANRGDIDQSVTDRLKLTLKKTDGFRAGATGTEPLLLTEIEQFAVASISGREESLVGNRAAFNAYRKKEGHLPWDGSVGNNFLQRHGAVIDHVSAKLFLKP